ncbi:MAG: hypothetical protein HFJ17_00185, partial [Clostridia bacterium]|nr:hypothetical protein [Clostridia bacterium]
MNKIKQYIKENNIHSIAILAMILMMLIVLIGYTKSNASDLSNITFQSTPTITYGDLTSSQYLYCVQAGGSIGNSGNVYYPDYYISIEGTKATAESKWGGKYSNDDPFNAKLAYILSSESFGRYGYGTSTSDHTSRQEQLWDVWNGWVWNSGQNLGLKYSNWSHGRTEKEYNIPETATDASIVSNVSGTIQTEGKWIGPINVTYIGKISSIVVRDSNGNEIQNDGCYYYDENKNAINVGDIQSGRNFYIYDDKERSLKDITVNVDGQGKVYTASIWLLHTDGGKQNLMHAMHGERDPKPASVTIGVESTNTLRVVKYGVNGNSEERQTRVKFVVNKEGTGYLCSRNATTGKMVYNVNDFYWTQDRNSATIFTTTNTNDGWEGYFQIANLPAGKYYVGEVQNPNSGYENSVITKCDLETYSGDTRISSTTLNNVANNENINGYSGKMQVVSADLSGGYTKIFRIYDGNEKGFNIYINKVRMGTETPVSGAKFKVRVTGKGWLAKDGKNYDYDVSYKDADEWKTSSDGKIAITGLDSSYRYEIYETYSPYDLEDQPGHASVQIGNNSSEKITRDDYAVVKDSKKKIIYCGTVSRSSNGSSVTLKVTNYNHSGDGTRVDKEYLKISGLVWLDGKVGKGDDETNYQHDDLYDEKNEKLYTGEVKVTLYNKSGSKVGTTSTTKTGKYSITDTGIQINSSSSKESIAKSLEGYYLKLEYSDKYSLVVPNKDKENGSKAVTKDGTTGTAYIYDLSSFVDKFYSYPTLNHMNMGLIETDATYNMTQNIAYVKVVMNGYTYTYKYGGTGRDENSFAAAVEFQTGKYSYTRPIYPSDIAQNDCNDLKVYVVYRIDITNTNDVNSSTGDKEEGTVLQKSYEYVELNLKASGLTDTFDSNRYELAQSLDGKETNLDKNAKNDFGKWEYAQGKTNEIEYKGDKLNGTIKPGEGKVIYVQFKVKKEALTQLLDGKEHTENLSAPTTAKVSAYHNYWRTESEGYWDGEVWRTHQVVRHRKTADKVKTSEAYYLKLVLSNERTIKGFVFEDENTMNNGEVVGNGKYDDSEKKVEKVKVDLMIKDENGNLVLAKMYNKAQSYAPKTSEELDIKSNDKGEYSFVGVVPGEYYVRFTYGNGTQIVKDASNKENVSIAEYKSTAVKEDCVKEALQTKAKGQWYKHMACNTDNNDKNKLSTAVDDLDQRAAYNQKTSTDDKIEAKTAPMSITVENTKEETVTVQKEEYGTKEIISGINFGIIDIPNISLASDKVVTNVQITNAQGNILADGNPASKNVPYVSDLDKGNHLVKGSNYTKSEINEQELYGSTLRLKYDITVQNNSQVNYYEDDSSKYYGNYYWFGDSSKSKEATVTVDTILDYLDPSIKYDENSI